MSQIITINNEQVTLDQALYAKTEKGAFTGGIIKISDWAEQQGYDKITKEVRREFDKVRKGFYLNNRKAMSLAVADHSLDVKKARPTMSKGQITGIDFSCRFAKDDSSAASEAARLQAENDDLKARLALLEKALGGN